MTGLLWQTAQLTAALTCSGPASNTACRVDAITLNGAVAFAGPHDVPVGQSWSIDLACTPGQSVTAIAKVQGVAAASGAGGSVSDTLTLTSNTVVCPASSAATPTVTFSVHLAPAGLAPPPDTTPLPVPPDSFPPHPRVWMTPQRVAFLQQQAAANTVRWQHVKAAADAQVARGTTYAGSDYYLMPDLCLAYLATGQQAYADRDAVLIQHFATDSNNEQGDSGYGYRYDIPVVTEGLDWCYAGLTPGVRHQAATWLMNRADWLWPETDSGGVKHYSTDNPADNYFWGFMQLGPAAVAAEGDDTLPEHVTGGDRPAFQLALVLAKWDTLGKPYLDGPGHGGAYVEGTNYDQGWKIGAFADGLQTAGIPIADPWFADALRWHLEYPMPDWAHKIPYGGQTRVSDAPLYTYDREHLFYLAEASHADSATRALIQTELGKIGYVPTSEGGSTSTLADELLYYHPEQPAAPDLTALPLSFLSDSTGVFVHRTSWTDPQALAWYFQSGPADNGNVGNNQLAIWQGTSWITVKGEVYSGPGEGYPTPAYNALTVGDTGFQKLGPGNNHGQIMALQESDSLIVLRGQADSAYGTANQWVNTRGVKDDLRTVAYLPDLAAFVILDQAAFKDTTAAPVDWWQSAGVPTFTDSTFTLASPTDATARCIGKVLSPAVAISDTAFYFNGAAPSSYAVRIGAPAHAVDRMLTVLQCGTVLPASGTLGPTSGTVTLGGVTVTLPFDAKQPVTRSGS